MWSVGKECILNFSRSLQRQRESYLILLCDVIHVFDLWVVIFHHILFLNGMLRKYKSLFVRTWK